MKKIVVTLFVLTGLALVGAAAWAWSDYQRFTQSALTMSGDGELFELQRGVGFGRLTAQLADRGLTKNTWHWKVLAKQVPEASRLKAGEYRIPAGVTPISLIQQLAEGEVVLHRFTIVEGWNLRELRAALAADAVLLQTTADLSDAELLEKLALAATSAEGQFLPETYRFPRGTTDLEFLQRANQGLQATLEKLWADRMDNLPLETPYEALTLASIIEKETGIPDERRRIAGVFIRRLQKDMRLQTDPTVIYGIGAGFDGDIRRKDLRTDTPYNTYTRKGLPPTPIAMAGPEAIAAALDPEPGDALYFVATGDGGHKFSATLAEHNAAVARYQLGRR